MKNEEEVRARARELVKVELKRRLDDAHVHLPHRCTHNYRHALDTRKTVVGEPNDGYNRIGDVRHLPLSQTMGLCMLGAEDPEQWKGDICDEPIDAQRCPYFNPKQDDQAVKTEFMAHLKEPAWVEENLPAVAALLWVAGESAAPVEPPKEPEPEPEPPSEPAPVQLEVRRPWWVRLWNWAKGTDASLRS